MNEKVLIGHPVKVLSSHPVTKVNIALSKVNYLGNNRTSPQP